MVSNLKTRCATIDWVKVLSNDLVEQFAEHYKHVRRATFVHFFVFFLNYYIISRNRLRPEGYSFHLNACLASEENEIEFLRVLSESLIFLLLPPSYSTTSAMKYLLREMLVFRGRIFPSKKQKIFRILLI
jgi:hypothetical protein